MTEQRVFLIHRFAKLIALVLLYASAILGWTEFLTRFPADYTLTVALAFSSLLVWVGGRAFFFLATGR
jgi:hypothetical protein